MEVRRAGEALLHGHANILTFLAPALARPCARRTALPLNRTFQQSPTLLGSLGSSRGQLRCLSSTPARFQNSTKTDAEQPPQPLATPAQKGDLSSMMNEALDFTKSSGTQTSKRTSHLASSASATDRASKTRARSSFDDLTESFLSRSSRPAPSASAFGHLDIGRMLDPDRRTDPTRELVEMPPPLPQYGPSVGRTVRTDERGMDLGRAFRTLDVQCARNKVRADFNRQRFHERPGLKRKRLKSERWRRRFKEGFRGMVKLVNQMRKQGW